MTDDTIEMFDAGEAETDADWLAIMDEIGEEAGYFEPLGKKHSAFFSDLGTVLLVSFETLPGVRGAGGAQMPLGYQIAAPRGWSSLSIVAHEPTWYRDNHVFGFFDRLIDDAFFEDFDRVVFYGAGMGGYGAAAFSVAAPGCTVLALAPQATLDTDKAEWDRRFLRARRLNFTDRFGFAPDMTDGCDKVFIVYDPIQQVDAVHAAMFRGPQIVKLRARHIGRDPQAELARINVLRQLIDAACAGTLNADRFYRLWRARRQHPQFLGRLVGRIQSQERPKRLVQALRAALEQVDHPQLRGALAKAEAALEKSQARQPAGDETPLS
ncbi:phosphoadenosine phosphosulfate reductase [Pararhodobacter oceanensis]|uniref:Phosphoadenosine phosphosulfate reductase n=1 Tax=Pararhodobacter oceanensis TaxID=2172121 RepID=A0A2T8HTI7_9RHOB|nr:phosphoadenosine phosphosulfate reductase [Pararhodobacter oceanensis]PVH28760.1 phosphoadenosine phosphosulfate reductase [Pararhodobacter oceanensis]